MIRCKDCDTVLVTMSSKGAGVCHGCESVRKDNAKVSYSDDVEMLRCRIHTQAHRILELENVIGAAQKVLGCKEKAEPATSRTPTDVECEEAVHGREKGIDFQGEYY